MIRVLGTVAAVVALASAAVAAPSPKPSAMHGMMSHGMMTHHMMGHATPKPHAMGGHMMGSPKPHAMGTAGHM